MSAEGNGNKHLCHPNKLFSLVYIAVILAYTYNEVHIGTFPNKFKKYIDPHPISIIVCHFLLIQKKRIVALLGQWTLDHQAINYVK